MGDHTSHEFTGLMESLGIESSTCIVAPSYVHDDDGFEWHTPDSGASAGQHGHEQYVHKDAHTKRVMTTVANGMHMFNKSSGKSAYKDKYGTVLDMANTSDYCMPDAKQNLLSLMDMSKNGCTILMSDKLPNMIEIWNAQGKGLDTKVENNIPWLLLKPLSKDE